MILRVVPMGKFFNSQLIKIVFFWNKKNSPVTKKTITINGYSVTLLTRFKLVGVHAWGGKVKCSNVGALLHRCLD